MKTPRLTLIGTAFILLVSCAGLVTAAAADQTRAAIGAQARVFMDAMARADAAGAARVFTADAKLLVPGVDAAIAGRAAIETFWRNALNVGVQGLVLTTIDLEGDGHLRVETGTYRAVGAGGGEIGRGHYLFVWKKEAGEWKIHRDFGSSSQAKVAATAGADASASAAADRVGFPRDYESTFKLLGVGATANNAAITTTYGNGPAVSITQAHQLPFPNGAVILMEFADPLKDGEGELLRDAKGGLIKGEITHIDVMRRGSGFGTVYGDNRAGEWEFASYRRDGGYIVEPAQAVTCAGCHRNAGAEKDFVFRLRVPVEAQ